MTTRSGRVTLAATVPLCLEYEDVCSRHEHVAVAELGSANLAVFLDAMVNLMEPVDVWFLWGPQLRDPGDELVLEAVNGHASAIATFNRRDFQPAADRFGINVLLPAEAIPRVHDSQYLNLLAAPARLDQERSGKAGSSRGH